MTAANTDTIICSNCGETASLKYSHRERLIERKLCFRCDFWLTKCKAIAQQTVAAFAGKGAVTNHMIVVDGMFYTIGREPSESERNGIRYGGMLGFGGARWDIELNDGTRIVSHNLWHNGEIPQRFRDVLVDSAKFLRGAERS